jgi:hypothetical protein
MRFGMEAGHTLVARRGGRRGGARAAVGASQRAPTDGSLITAWREKRGCAPLLEPDEAGLLSNRLTQHSSACVEGSFGSSSDRYDAVLGPTCVAFGNRAKAADMSRRLHFSDYCGNPG